LNFKGKEAGDALLSKANIFLKMGERDEAATAYMDASKAYKKTHPTGKMKTSAY
jgi:alpha-soluble NSF attachment protein